MPWSALAGKVSGARGTIAWPEMPLTLATLTLADDAPPDAVAFHREAEMTALAHWASRGGIILALSSPDRAELTLLCPDPIDAVARMLGELPLAAAGLARFDIRVVMPIRLPSRSPACPAGRA